MGFYNLNPDRIRDLQSPDAGELLTRDGGNITSVLGRITSTNQDAKQRIEEYLSQVVPGVRRVDVRVVGPKETLEFRQDVAGSGDPWRFFATNMSDGTLRALGVLVALFQSRNGGQPHVPLIGIEEPEVALHPAATGALLGSLRDASVSTQVIVTSHSPDLLDDENIDVSSILAVVSEEGVTKIGPVDEAGRAALASSLYTPGELLRLSQLLPDPASVSDVVGRQLRLFDDE
jgi:predicted ATPase